MVEFKMKKAKWKFNRSLTECCAYIGGFCLRIERTSGDNNPYQAYVGFSNRRAVSVGIYKNLKTAKSESRRFLLGCIESAYNE